MTEPTSLGIRRVLVVFAHPSLESLNGAVLTEFKAGLESAGLQVRVRDLHRLNFNPVVDADEWTAGFEGKVPELCQAEHEHILWADALVWIFPAWNFTVPAMFKGYLDRVFLIPGFSFDSDPTGSTYLGGRLRHKKALIIQTLGGALQTGFRFGNVTDYVQCAVSSLQYAGIREVHVEQFWNMYRQMEPGPETRRVLNRAKELGETFDQHDASKVQIISTQPR